MKLSLLLAACVLFAPAGLTGDRLCEDSPCQEQPCESDRQCHPACECWEGVCLPPIEE
jgi:hypothetical protein